MVTLKFKMEEYKDKKPVLSQERLEQHFERKFGKGVKKIGKAITSSKITYKSGNPLKKLLKVDRPTVKVSGTKERINLMRGTW